jgi:hypothetical protein
MKSSKAFDAGPNVLPLHPPTSGLATTLQSLSSTTSTTNTYDSNGLLTPSISNQIFKLITKLATGAIRHSIMLDRW